MPDATIVGAIERLPLYAGADLWFRYGDRTVPVTGIPADEVPARLGFVRRPVQPAGGEECR